MKHSKYFINAIWLALEKLLRLFAALFVGVLIARYLGPSNYGNLNFAIGFTSLFGAVAALGLDSVLVREFIGKKYADLEILGTSFVLKVAATLLMWLLIFIACSLLEYDTKSVTLIAIVSFATIFQSTNVIDFKLQAHVKSKFVAKLLLLQLLVSSLFKVYLVYVEASLESFAWVFTFESIIYSIGLLTINKAVFKDSILRWKWNKSLALELLKEGLPYIFAGIAIAAYLKIDIIMVKTLLDDHSAGVYSAAVRLSEAWYFLPAVIISSFFPAIVKSKLVNNRMFYSQLKQLSAGLIMLALFISVPASIFSTQIINTLYGTDYSGSTSILLIHIWSTIFVFLGMISHRWHVIEKEQGMALRRSVIGLLLNVTLNFFLIPIFGAEGAAISTLISQFYISFLIDLFNRKTRKLFFVKLLSVTEVVPLLFYMKKKLKGEHGN